ncbi:MAG: BrnT family toxin [Anaerolineales bacterium]|nr:BrnT family toxin [Anaerolineales bacterium]
MEFEWDEVKRRANARKHGIDFADAATIFEGKIVVISDDRFDYGEMRYIAFGPMKGQVVKVIVVAYTERGEKIRLISARKALKHEENFYFKQIAD